MGDFSEKKACIYERSKWKAFYEDKYRELFLNRWQFEGLTKQQRLYILKKVWFGDSNLCAFSIINEKESFMGALPPEDLRILGENVGLGFAPFAPSTYSIYDYPSTGLIINERGAPYIPGGSQKVGRDVILLENCTIGKSAHRLIEQLVNLEMKMRKNLALSSAGAGIEVSPECPCQSKDINEKMLGDEIAPSIGGGDTKSVQPFNLGVPYLVDKIRIEKEARENELKCLLGLDSITTEKKERLITSEAESNDAICDVSKRAFFEPMKSWFEEIEKVLGFKLSIIEPLEKKEIEEDEEDENESEME